MYEEKLAKLVRQVKGESLPGPVDENSRFVDDLGLTSVNTIMLLTLIEREFGLDLKDSMNRLAETQTVSEAAYVIRELAEARWAHD